MIDRIAAARESGDCEILWNNAKLPGCFKADLKLTSFFYVILPIRLQLVHNVLNVLPTATAKMFSGECEA